MATDRPLVVVGLGTVDPSLVTGTLVQGVLLVDGG